MKAGLGIKVFLLMIFIAMISLSSSLIIISLTNDDFKKYTEGQKLDILYWIISDLEDDFKKYNGWNLDSLKEDMVWSSFLGFKFILKNNNKLIITTPNLNLSNLSEKEVNIDQMIAYPLFNGDAQIGTLFVRFEDNTKSQTFKTQILKYFLITTFVIGVLTLILSYIFSRKLVKPLNILTRTISEYGNGNYEMNGIINSNDEIGKLSKTFVEMGQKLKKYEELRKKTLTNVAHELRTPLTIIRGNLEAIIDGIFKADDKTFKSMLEEIQRLQGIIESIEKLTKAEASSLNLNISKFNLKDFFKEIEKQFLNEISNKRINITLNVSKDIYLKADRDKMKQVFINLISNAIKAVSENGFIDITAIEKDNQVIISIKDSGKGIKSESLPFIFERFYSESGSFGVGLSIVKEIIEAHNGKINVKSKIGYGSEFTILLKK